MRKLLVASQKGGVGKTTTSINLAAATALAGAHVLLLDADPLSSISSSLGLPEHPHRRSLRDAGVDLPGVLVCDVIPGLDVLSPYEDGGCTDEHLDRLIALLATPAVRESFGCLIVDTPPFMGAKPGQLLAACDEFIIVMRAEPMAYRTLPAFLELVGRQKPAAGADPIKMRGIVVTLPEGEQAGGRWERELRGRFGSRILSEVVPYDEVVSQTRGLGQVVSESHRQSPVAQAYHALVGSLELAADARTTRPQGAAPTLLQASASLPNGLTPQSATAPVVVEPTPAPTPAPAPAVKERPAAPAATPSSAQSTRHMPRPRLAPLVARQRPAPPPAASPPTPRTPPPVKPAALPTPGPRPPVMDRPMGPAPFPVGVALVWVGAAVVLGTGLRFMPLPDLVLPVIAGFTVAAVVILAMLYLMPVQEDEVVLKATSGVTPLANQPTGRLSALTRRAFTRAGRSGGD